MEHQKKYIFFVQQKKGGFLFVVILKIFSMFIWEQTTDVNNLSEILTLVEPHEMERNSILTRIKHNVVYKCFVAKNQDHSNVAIIIATFLPLSQTVHVEDFALHPNIRGQGHARQMWKDWRTLVRNTWTNVEALTIEVYLQNVAVWRKIMDVAALLPQTYELDLAPGVFVCFMGKNITCSPHVILTEWKHICNKILPLSYENNNIFFSYFKCDTLRIGFLFLFV